MTPNIIDQQEEVSAINNTSKRKFPVRKNARMRMEGWKYTGIKTTQGGFKVCVDQSERIMHPRSCPKRRDKDW